MLIWLGAARARSSSTCPRLIHSFYIIFFYSFGKDTSAADTAVSTSYCLIFFYWLKILLQYECFSFTYKSSLFSN